MAGRVREAGFELKLRLWELQSLYDVGLSIAGTLDMESLADDILMKSVSLLNARKGTLVIWDDADGQRLLVKDIGGPLLTGAEEIHLTDVYVSNDRGERLEALALAPAEKLLGVPILSDGRRLGLLFVADKENRAGGVDDFDASDERILSLFGNQAAIALENARLHRDAVEMERMEREIELAAPRSRRRSSRRRSPTVRGDPHRRAATARRDRSEATSTTSTRSPTGASRSAWRTSSGKGIPAALLVSTVHACLHLLVDAGASDLTGLVARINRHLVGLLRDAEVRDPLRRRSSTPRDRSLRYVNAGHNPGIWLSGAGVTLLPSGGVPIGHVRGGPPVESRVVLAPGDLVVLYSDGITEAVDARTRSSGWSV